MSVLITVEYKGDMADQYAKRVFFLKASYVVESFCKGIVP